MLTINHFCVLSCHYVMPNKKYVFNILQVLTNLVVNQKVCKCLIFSIISGSIYVFFKQIIWKHLMLSIANNKNPTVLKEPYSVAILMIKWVHRSTPIFAIVSIVFLKAGIHIHFFVLLKFVFFSLFKNIYLCALVWYGKSECIYTGKYSPRFFFTPFALLVSGQI